MKHAIALLRVSTDEQSLDRQEDAARTWGAATGHEVTILREAGVSGCARKRPGLEKMLRLCRSSAVRPDAVWVRELSRLGRSLVGVVGVMSELDSLGVRVVVAGAGIDYGNASGRFQAQIVAAFAEYEREMICERTRDGLAAARRRGVQLGARPYEWPEEADEALRGMVADGMRQIDIAASGRLDVKRPVRDAETDEWTWKWCNPGLTKIRERMLALGLRKGRAR